MIKNRILSMVLVFALIMSLLPTMAGAAEADFSNLIVDTAEKATSGGALQIINNPDQMGQKTLGNAAGEPIQLRGMSTHGLQWFPEIINDNAFAALADDWGSNVISSCYVCW